MELPTIAFVKHYKTGAVHQIGIQIPQIVFEKIHDRPNSSISCENGMTVECDTVLANHGYTSIFIRTKNTLRLLRSEEHFVSCRYNGEDTAFTETELHNIQEAVLEICQDRFPFVDTIPPEQWEPMK